MHHARNGFLTAKGLKLQLEAAQRECKRPGVDNMGPLHYLDSMGSVSGLELERDLYEFISDSDIDEQERRFHNGS
jgi:hypothetical protein